jgi:predicted patatin/cPLA2 family phospholipase
MSKCAVVLEGGSLRCMFSAGVTDIMLEKGIAFDGLYGVSAGALTGVNYVSGQPGRTAEVNLRFVNDKRYLGVRNLILHKSLFNFDFMFGEVCDVLVPLDRETFASSPCAFTAVATSCRTGKPVYFEKNSCKEIYSAIRASASLPLVSPMVQVEGEPCLDGGLSDAIPFEKALADGYDKVVVITTREHGFRKPMVRRGTAKLYARMYRGYPQLVRTLINVPRMYAHTLNRLDQLEQEGKVFVIRPPKPVDVSRTEKDTEKLRALYDEGREQCLAQLEDLKAYLGKETTHDQ